MWDSLPRPVQQQIVDKGIRVYAVDAGRIASDVGLAGRINVVLQTCFFAISDVLPRDKAIARIKEAVTKTYGEHGADVLNRELAAVDHASTGCTGSRFPTGSPPPTNRALRCPPPHRSSSAPSPPR